MGKTTIKKTRNSEILQDFINYCKANPDLRFWQALRNWSEFSFIFVSKTHLYTDLKDTFYFEGKDK